MKQEVYNEIKRRIRTLSINSYPLDDLLQDTIEKLIKKGYKENNYVYLCKKVAYRLIVDHYRKTEKFKCIYDKEPECISNDEYELDYIIPKEFEELYILRYKLNMKYKEISTFLSTPLGTVKNRIHKMIIEVKRVNGL